MFWKGLHYFWDRVEITRPHNLAVAVLVIFAGWAASGGGSPTADLLWALLAGALVAAAGNVINDYYDAAIDRINKPKRPIPSGRITPGESLLLYAVLTGLAISAAVGSGSKMLATTLIWTACLFLYSARLKRRLLLGNLTVSLVCSSGFLAGAWLSGSLHRGWWPTAIAFLFLMGREIVKDVEDLPGDRACGARTLARRLGERGALRVALAFFLLFALLAQWPYWSQLCGTSYLMTYAFGMLPLLVLAMWLMFRDTSPRNLVRVSWILKLEMFVGVLGFYFGQAR